MKQTWIAAFAASALLSGAAFGQQSDEDHGAHHGEESATQSSQVDRGAQQRMMMGGMGMEAHQEHMTRMRSLMEEARNTDDPEERRRLMAEHRDMMRNRMNAMMGDQEAMMEACAQRMSMMQDMMQQMMARDELVGSEIEAP